MPRLPWGLLLSIALHGSWILAAAWVVPPDLGVEASPSTDEATYEVMVQVQGTAVPERVEALSPWPRTSLPAVGDLGQGEAEDRDARYGVAGPADHPDPHVSHSNSHGGPRRFEDVQSEPARRARLEGPTAPWGRDESLGHDAVDARAHMFGETVEHALGRGEMAAMPNLVLDGDA